MRRLAPPLAVLTLLASPAAYAASIPDTVNRVRIDTCRASPPSRAALRSQQQLDQAARQIARGASLEQALEAAGYRSRQSVLIRVSASSSDDALASVLAKHFCSRIAAPAFSEIGTARRDDSVWIVLAAPFAAPALEDPRRVAARVLELVNQARARGRRCGTRTFAPTGPLQHAVTLDTVASTYARELAKRRLLSHVGADGSTPAQRISKAGYRWVAVGENLASGQLTADEVVDGWLRSTEHCTNLMDVRFSELGIGYFVDWATPSGTYWVQLFAMPRR